MKTPEEHISGFSKLSKLERVDWVVKNYLSNSAIQKEELKKFWHHNEEIQKVFDEFSENTITNFYVPYGVVPNFLINGKTYCVPMVIEESSVVAAAAKSAKFWRERGGFHTEVVSTLKRGQVHFYWSGNSEKLLTHFPSLKQTIIQETQDLVSNMEARGGGLKEVVLVNKTHQEKDYYQLMMLFDTCDAMGANFINTVLERAGRVMKEWFMDHPQMIDEEKNVDVLMSILSNYTPECLVRSWVECSVEELGEFSGGMGPQEFATRFARAVGITQVDTYRAVTHNKGIFNGIDAVVVATGNDFRAVEASGHAYAARNGQYQGLSQVSLKDGRFKFSLELPLALGTIGGLTVLHPLARASLKLLGQPQAPELMSIVASVGLAQNFAAVSSLVTTGIQKGHMKMHLLNILRSLEATEEEVAQAKEHFADKVISYKEVREFIAKVRKLH